MIFLSFLLKLSVFNSWGIETFEIEKAQFWSIGPLMVLKNKIWFSQKTIPNIFAAPRQKCVISSLFALLFFLHLNRSVFMFQVQSFRKNNVWIISPFSVSTVILLVLLIKSTLCFLSEWYISFNFYYSHQPCDSRIKSIYCTFIAF